ncbi:MAG TPA: hypothetical protein VFQ95_01300 [Rhodanobacteraceae bacterium]|nr:hypothetical protein [Rhodanobacteraceae bacterium]
MLDPVQLGHLLRDLDAYSGTLPVRAALRLAPLVFLRPGEMRKAEWPEFNPDAAEWNVPASRRKLTQVRKHDPQTQPHLVPLSRQAVTILRELQPLTGGDRFVFPARATPPAALRHGAAWRTASHGLSIRVARGTIAELDSLAAAMHRSPNDVVNEALEEYIATRKWRIERIQAGIEDAKHGRVVPAEQVFTEIAANHGWKR